MPTNIHIYRDPRTQQEQVVYGFQVTRDCLYDYERDLRLRGSRHYDDNLTSLIGNRLVPMQYSPPVFRAWVDLSDGVLSAHLGSRYDTSNPKHQAGMCLLAMPEQAPELYRSLVSLDNRCRVQLEVQYNNLDMAVDLRVCITVPQFLLYGSGVHADDQRILGSGLSLTRRVATMEVELGGMVERIITSNPTVGITLGGVELGEFRDTPVNVAESALTGPERERILQEQAEEAHQAYLALQRVEEVAELAEAALAAPQGDLAPRKVKRVSVGIDNEALPAESPRRLKVRRDRNN